MIEAGRLTKGVAGNDAAEIPGENSLFFPVLTIRGLGVLNVGLSLKHWNSILASGM